MASKKKGQPVQYIEEVTEEYVIVELPRGAANSSVIDRLAGARFEVR